MSRKSIITVAVVAGFVVVALAWQRKAVADLRQQNEALLAAKAESVRLETENEELPGMRAAPAGGQAAVASTELLRLRNEVRQLRAARSEVDRLRVENERLGAEIKSGIALPQKLSEMEGFVAKDSWSNAGFATPEATLRTFFWAIREEDLTQLAECVAPKDKNHLLRLLEPGAEVERGSMTEKLRRMTQTSGFRIADRQVETEDEVTLGIQAIAGGAVIPTQLRRYGNEWKVKDF